MWDDAQDEELQASYRQELAFEFPGCAHAFGPLRFKFGVLVLILPLFRDSDFY